MGGSTELVCQILHISVSGGLQGLKVGQSAKSDILELVKF